MSDVLGLWIAAFIDWMTGTLTLPLWAAVGLAALFAIFFLFALTRKGRRRSNALARLVLLGAIAAGAWYLFDRYDLAAERRALDARAVALTARAIAPGSALACLDGPVSEAVAGSCEKALFASPEASAAAISYVGAQLSLLADARNHARRDRTYEPVLAGLRQAAELDRFGMVAHVLVTRDGCTPDNCAAFAMLSDSRRISVNMAERNYDVRLGRYLLAWAGAGGVPVAAAAGAPATEALAPTASARTPNNLYFPSAASIPPVNIMTAEPETGGPQQPAGATGQAAAPAPPRRAAAPQPKQRPTNLAPPAAAPQP
jgi:hypothetical protein